jgi:hypothetical protein
MWSSTINHAAEIKVNENESCKIGVESDLKSHSNASPTTCRAPGPPTSFRPAHLRRHKIAGLPELEPVLGDRCRSDRLSQIEAARLPRQPYSSGTLLHPNEIARFDHHGLWSHEGVWFSPHGTVRTTVESPESVLQQLRFPGAGQGCARRSAGASPPPGRATALGPNRGEEPFSLPPSIPAHAAADPDSAQRWGLSCGRPSRAAGVSP